MEAETDVEDFSMNVTGTAGITFTESNYEWLPDFTLELQVAGQTVVGRTGGSITGSYETADGVISVRNENPGLTIEVEVDGMTMDGSESGNDLQNSAPFGEANYRCVDGVPEIDFWSGPGSPTTTILLEPAG